MKCKKCGSNVIGEMIMTNPPQEEYRCEKCGLISSNDVTFNVSDYHRIFGEQLHHMMQVGQYLIIKHDNGTYDITTIDGLAIHLYCSWETVNNFIKTLFEQNNLIKVEIV